MYYFEIYRTLQLSYNEVSPFDGFHSAAAEEPPSKRLAGEEDAAGTCSLFFINLKFLIYQILIFRTVISNVFLW